MNVSFARKRRLARNKLKSPFTHIKKGKSCAFQLSRRKKETFSFALPRKKRKKIFSHELPGGEGFFRVVELCSGRGFPEKKKKVVWAPPLIPHTVAQEERDTPLTSPRNAYMILLFPRAMLYLRRAALHITLWHTILSPPLSVLLLLLLLHPYPHRWEHV